MPTSRRPARGLMPSLPFVTLCVLLAILWLAGGASRADALGQVPVRAASFAALAMLLLFGERWAWREARVSWLLLLAATALTLLQLMPLPPVVWQALPGRAILVEAGALAGDPGVWRPWSMVPGATVNAAASLVVPIAVLALMAALDEREWGWVPVLFLGSIVATTLIGVLQVSGAGFNNPLINETVGQVGGMFANRNHFALYLSLGCLLASAWAFPGGRRAGWRGPVALGLVLLFLLMTLASGSRAGAALCVMAITLSMAMIWSGLRREFRHLPRWMFLSLVVAAVVLLGAFVLLSITADRAASVNRLFEIDQGQDMRTRGLPIVLGMVRTYFPMGAGLGSFDPVFRMHEPFGLLKLTYFNHAHNDFLEIVLDAGLAGALLLAAALAWWAMASVRAWKGSAVLPRLGSAMLLLVLIASLFDYPARTPAIMAILVVAAVWLQSDRPALP